MISLVMHELHLHVIHCDILYNVARYIFKILTVVVRSQVSNRRRFSLVVFVILAVLRRLQRMWSACC